MPTCTNCNCSYTSQKGFEQHLNSKKHCQNSTKIITKITRPGPTVEELQKIKHEEQFSQMKTQYDIKLLKLKNDLA